MERCGGYIDKMQRSKKLRSIFVMVAFLMSSISLSVPCEDRIGQNHVDNSSISVTNSAGFSVALNSISDKNSSSRPSSSEQPSDHCHCISHSCCVYLTNPPNHELANGSQKKGPPQIVTTLISRNLPPPTRPPVS